MHSNFISNLLNLEGVYVKKVTQSDFKVTLYLATPVKATYCPSCNNTTSNVHDYSNQTIKDIPFISKRTLMVLNKDVMFAHLVYDLMKSTLFCPNIIA